jgi:hypothetical protein
MADLLFFVLILPGGQAVIVPMWLNI